jgi:hypothetical protein
MSVNRYTKADLRQKVSPNFTVEDFWADSSLSEILLDTDLAFILEKFLDKFGERPRLRNRYNGVSATRYAPVSSAGFRISTGSGASNSYHLFGRAVDFEIPGVPSVKLAQYAETLPEVGGIGLYYWAGQLERQTHIHIDTRTSRARWGWKGSYYSGGRLPGFGGIPCVFKRSSQSAGVEIIQRWLSSQGYRDIAPDGEYGAKTAAAVKDWQKKNGLKADGMFGRDTNSKARVFNW